MTICDYIIELILLQTMFYATGEIGLPVHNQFAQKSSRGSSYCCGRLMLLLAAITIYALFHLLSLSYGVILVQQDIISDLSDYEEIELVTVGCIGSVTSLVAAFGLWFKLRSFLLPLLMFMIFTMILDSVSVFYYFTSPTHSFDQTSNKFDLYRGIHRNQIIPTFTQDAIFLIIGKIIFSLFLSRAIIRTYRYDLRLRGGRSPVRCNNNNNQEIYSLSPGPAKSGKYRKFSNVESI